MKQNDQPIAVESEDFKLELIKEFNSNDPPVIGIETGTWLGTGSTKLIIDAYCESEQAFPFDLYTIESNKDAYDEAVQNLSPYPWVHPTHGLSLDYAYARNQIWNDVLLDRIDEYPELYCDAEKDLKQYYLTEISPTVTGAPREDNFLEVYINMFQKERILFFLDSAGGLGWTEWTTVMKSMGPRGYLVGCDDINHVKHYRSYMAVKENIDKRWKLKWTDGRVMLAERLKA